MFLLYFYMEAIPEFVADYYDYIFPIIGYVKFFFYNIVKYLLTALIVKEILWCVLWFNIERQQVHLFRYNSSLKIEWEKHQKRFSFCIFKH